MNWEATMSEVSIAVVKKQLLAVLKEAFDGPTQAWSYFTDNNSEAGVLGTIGTKTAQEASAVIGGTTIAAHVHHATFALGASAAWITGDRSSQDWNESWRISTVDEKSWRELQQRIQRAYERLRAAIEQHGTNSAEAVGGAIGAVAHAAYHLGAIRQKMAVIRARDGR
jgi:hypothetical protein